MASDTKLCHFTLVGANEEEIKQFSTALGKIKDKLPLDIEFIVTNERYILRDVSWLLKELIDLYKRENKILDFKKAALEKMMEK